MNRPPAGITPPTPGLEHEEPEFGLEADIPTDDGGRASSGSSDRPRNQREERGKPERE